MECDDGDGVFVNPYIIIGFLLLACAQTIAPSTALGQGLPCEVDSSIQAQTNIFVNWGTEINTQTGDIAQRILRLVPNEMELGNVEEITQEIFRELEFSIQLYTITACTDALNRRRTDVPFTMEDILPGSDNNTDVIPTTSYQEVTESMNRAEEGILILQMHLVLLEMGIDPGEVQLYLSLARFQQEASRLQ